MKTGIFLCGGGALGAWQSGVLRKLIENNINADVISGFSIGAINSAFYCFDAIDKTQKIWSKIDNNKIFELSISYSKPVEVSIYEGKSSFITKLYNKAEKILSGLNIFSNKPIYRILSRYITKNSDFKKNLKFYCISHCVEESKPYIVEFNSDNYNREKFIKMLIASSAIPFIFPKVEEIIDNKKIYLVDGGVIGKEYFDFSFFKGLDRIIVISNVCDSDKDFKIKKFGFIDFFEKKVRRILFYHNLLIENHLKKLDNNTKVYFIKPLQPLTGRVIDFNPKINVKLYNQGVNDALFYIKEFFNA